MYSLEIHGNKILNFQCSLRCQTVKSKKIKKNFKLSSYNNIVREDLKRILADFEALLESEMSLIRLLKGKSSSILVSNSALFSGDCTRKIYLLSFLQRTT